MSRSPLLALLLVLACGGQQATQPPADAAPTADLAADSAPDQRPTPETHCPPGLGCALIPECPGSCQSPCGCCGCAPGLQHCTGKDGKAALQVCGPTGGCWEVTTCPTGGCVEYEPGKAACVTSPADCGRVEAAYLRDVNAYSNLIANPGAVAPFINDKRSCSDDASCRIVPGHCSIGLGGCWYVGTVEAPFLARYASLWQQIGCAAPVTCDCPPLPVAARCPQWGGTCVTRDR